MEGKFTIFAVCIAVVQISLPMVSPSVPGPQDRAMLDLSLLTAYNALAVLQSEKIAQTIYAIERRGCLAKSCLQNNYGGEESSYAERACQDELITVGVATSDTVLAAASIINPEAPSNVRAIINGTQTVVIEGFCSAIVLALGKDSSGVGARIQAITDRIAPYYSIFDEALFAAFLNGRSLHPRTEAAIQRIKRRAIFELSLANNNTLSIGAASLVSCGTENETDALSAIAIARDRSFAGLKADVDAKFEVMKSLVMESYIVEFGVPVSSCSIGATDAAAGYDCQNAASSESATCETDTPDVVVGNGNEVGECDSQSARATATFQAAKGVAAGFDTIKGVLAEVNLRQQTIAERGSCEFPNARRETYAIEIVAVDAVMDALLIAVNSGSTSAVQSYRNAAKSKVNETLDIIYDTIGLICIQNSPQNMAKIQAMETSAIRACSSIIEVIYDAIRSYLQNFPESRAVLKYAKTASLSKIRKSVHSTFDGIEALLTNNSSQSQTQSGNSSLSLNNAKAEASFEIKAAVRSIFDVIESFCQTSRRNQVEILAALSEIRSKCEIALQRVDQSVERIFTVIFYMTGFVLIRQNEREDSLGDIESSRAEKSAAYQAALEAIFCSIPSTHSVAFLTVQNSAIVAMQEAVDNEYKAIGAALDIPSNYSRIQAFEAEAIRQFVSMVSDIYIVIRREQACDSETEAALDLAQEETSFNIEKAAQTLFDAIRTLAAAVSSRNRIDYENNLSSIEAGYNEAECDTYNLIQIIFDLIELASSTCGENQAEISDESCAGTVY